MSPVIALIRPDSTPVSTRVGSVARPSLAALRTDEWRRAAAAIVFEGMQSQRWAAPPTISFSMSVTRPPFEAAVVAAWVPAGPPPMMTRCLRVSLISFPLFHAGR